MSFRPIDDPRFTEVPDRVVFTLRFPSGVLANCSTAFSGSTSRHYRVHCKDDWYGELLRLGSHGAMQLSSQLQAPKYYPLSLRERDGVRGIVKRRSVAMACFSFQQREILK